MLVILRDARDSETALDSRTAARLAELGITHVAIARDAASEAVVLDGWAFNPRTSAQAATDIVSGAAPTQALRVVLDTTLSRDDTAQQWANSSPPR